MLRTVNAWGKHPPRGMNRARIAHTLALAALCAALFGCRAALEPSVRERRASFYERRAQFKGDTVHATLETFLLIAAAEGAGPPAVDPDSGAISLPAAAPGAYSQGLAVGVDPAGYLLTARHNLRARNYVLGWMNGRLRARPARVVSVGTPSDPDADLALVAVDAALDYCARFGPRPATGQPVFAVVCEHPDSGIGGELDMAAGSVLLARAGPASSGAPLIATDIPLWHGDSGGPLLCASGDLVGINSAIRFAWVEGGEVLGDYARFSRFADGAEVAGAIARDRALRGAGPR